MRRGLRVENSETQLQWRPGEGDVPAGWRTREKVCADKKVRTYYLSPGGQTFPSRLAAFQHMLRAGTYSRYYLSWVDIFFARI
jgi:hypothetical protein